MKSESETQMSSHPNRNPSKLKSDKKARKLRREIKSKSENNGEPFGLDAFAKKRRRTSKA